MNRIPAIAVTTLILAVAGCSPSEKDAPLETKTRAEAAAETRQQADALAVLLGGTVSEPEESTPGCVGRAGESAGDGRFSSLSTAAVKLPGDKHVAALRAVHDDATARGWEISDYRTFSDGATGILSTRDPQTGVSVSLVSSRPPVQIAMVLAGRCHLPADG